MIEDKNEHKGVFSNAFMWHWNRTASAEGGIVIVRRVELLAGAAG